MLSPWAIRKHLTRANLKNEGKNPMSGGILRRINPVDRSLNRF